MPDSCSAPSRISRRLRAVAVVGIGDARFAKRRDRRVALAELLANFAEREPGGGKAGRELDGLQQQIGGGDEIALQLQVAREFEPAVGDQIAGGQEQARGHRLEPIRPFKDWQAQDSNDLARTI